MSNLNGDEMEREFEPELLTAYALGQLKGAELEQGARAASGQAVQQDIGIRKVAEAVAASRNAETLPGASAALRERIEARLLETAKKAVQPKYAEAGEQRRMWWRKAVAVMCLGGGVAGLLFAISFAVVATKYRRASRSVGRVNDALATAINVEGAEASTQPPAKASENQLRYQGAIDEAWDKTAVPDARAQTRNPQRPIADFESAEARPTAPEQKLAQVPKRPTDEELRSEVTGRSSFGTAGPAPVASDPFAAPQGEIPGEQAYVPPKGFANAPRGRGTSRPGAVAGGGYGSADGGYGGGYGGMAGGGYVPTPEGFDRRAAKAAPPANVPGAHPESYVDGFFYQPPATPNVPLSSAPAKDGLARVPPDGTSAATNRFANTVLPGENAPNVVAGQQGQNAKELSKLALGNEWEAQRLAVRGTDSLDLLRDRGEVEIALRSEVRSRVSRAPGTEQYEAIVENAFLDPRRQPLSTFSIDVDTASYANVRRFLTSGRLPPANAVRIEELVNYFRYEGSGFGVQGSDSRGQETGDRGQREPFSVNMEVAECPWREGHLLLRVGLKGKEVRRAQRPASNLVFLLDVSGSMEPANKLPLLKTAMQMFVRELGENDRLSIVTYAGEAGLKLPPTRGHEQEKILNVIESLTSGGSTNGSAGIELAYEQAAAYFEQGGTNRVILCTDGDLNVGVTSDDALVELIKKKAKSGTFLTVLGFGEGNLKDAKMEKLADNGNGLYAYIDSVREARKVLVEQLTGSTITIAKDVKIQIEFNPAEIASYRLLGYENRVLAAEDFNNDKKDAGEIGAGHMVTALYELVPVGTGDEAQRRQGGVDPLKYQAEVGGQKSEVRGQATTKQMKMVLDRDGLTADSPVAHIPPKVEGVVLEVSDKDLLEISIGADDGLKIGHTLDVYRGNTYLGRIEIKKTNPDRSVGQIKKELQRGQIKRGDSVTTNLTEMAASGELLTLKLRYKEPEGETSKLLEYPLKAGATQGTGDRRQETGVGQSPPYRFEAASEDMRFAAAVASFGMILRRSEHRGSGNLAAVSEIAAGAMGNDPGGYRAEFLDLVRKAQSLGAR